MIIANLSGETTNLHALIVLCSKLLVGVLKVVVEKKEIIVVQGCVMDPKYLNAASDPVALRGLTYGASVTDVECVRCASTMKFVRIRFTCRIGYGYSLH